LNDCAGPRSLDFSARPCRRRRGRQPRERRPAVSTGRAAAIGPPPQGLPVGVGSTLLGLALTPLDRLAVDLGHRPARDSPRVASPGLSALLALEVPEPTGRTSSNRPGNSQPHPPHGHREPHLGSASDSSRTPLPRL